MKVTVTQIARHLQVSQPTVSAVLSGRGGNTRVSTELAQRIRDAAQRMGFRPNAAAKAMATGRFNTIAILQSTVGFLSFLPRAMFDTIHDALAARQMHLMIAKVPDAKLADPQYVPQILKELICDGLLINYQARIPPQLVTMIEQHRLPAIWINSKHPHNCVYPDDFAGAYQATRRLIELGHRRIAFSLFCAFEHFSGVDRRDGYAQAMREAGLSPQILQYERTPTPVIVGQLTDLLAGPSRPTAVIGYTGEVARSWYRAALRAGLGVPDHLSIIGFSDEPIAEVDGTLATVALPGPQMGQTAVEQLLQLIQTPGKTFEPVQIECGFVPGQSLGIAR